MRTRDTGERPHDRRARGPTAFSDVLSVFLREYLTVVAMAGASAVRGIDDGRSDRLSAKERRAAIVGLTRKVWEKSGIALRDVRQEALR